MMYAAQTTRIIVMMISRAFIWGDTGTPSPVSGWKGLIEREIK
jgi:hypothetical protein